MNRLPTSLERWLALVFVCILLGVFAVSVAQRLARPGADPVVHTPNITVSVQGAVQAPGTYTVPFGARASELLELAGGFASGAAEALFRPAQVLRDGEQLFIPTHATDTPLVSLNSASVAQLETLPGVGPVMAERIIAARPFHRVEDLRQVSGVGEKTFARLAPHVGL